MPCATMQHRSPKQPFEGFDLAQTQTVISLLAVQTLETRTLRSLDFEPLLSQNPFAGAASKCYRRTGRRSGHLRASIFQQALRSQKAMVWHEHNSLHMLSNMWYGNVSLFAISATMYYMFFQRIRDERNEKRFYSCSLQENLLGELVIERRWGRLGSPGNKLTNVYASLDEALNSLFSIRAVRLRKQYEEIEFKSDLVRPKVLIPKSKRFLLDLEIQKVFPNDRKFSFINKRTSEFDISYVGDLVAMEERELAVILSRYTNMCYDAVPNSNTDDTSVYQRLCDVKTELYALGLALNSDTGSWKRPIPSGVPFKLVQERTETVLDNVVYLAAH